MFVPPPVSALPQGGPPPLPSSSFCDFTSALMGVARLSSQALLLQLALARAFSTPRPLCYHLEAVSTLVSVMGPQPCHRGLVGSHGGSAARLACRPRSLPPLACVVEPPNWRLVVVRQRDGASGREEDALRLEPTDGRWVARELEVVIDATDGLGIELTE